MDNSIFNRCNGTQSLQKKLSPSKNYLAKWQTLKGTFFNDFLKDLYQISYGKMTWADFKFNT